jgi:hypothetical protein
VRSKRRSVQGGSSSGNLQTRIRMGSRKLSDSSRLVDCVKEHSKELLKDWKRRSGYRCKCRKLYWTTDSLWESNGPALSSGSGWVAV